MKKDSKNRKKVNPVRPGRLNIIIDPDLKKWAHQYARERHTNVTAIVTAHLVQLRDTENVIDVEQI